jgi:hypothetical protein
VYDYQVQHVHTISTFIGKVQEVWAIVQEAQDAISIYSAHQLQYLGVEIASLESIITKLFPELIDEKWNLKTRSLHGSIESNLSKFYTDWKAKSKEINLITSYMEPSKVGLDSNFSHGSLRSIIMQGN